MNLRIYNDVKARLIIHKVSIEVPDEDVLNTIKWEDIGYIYKSRAETEVFKISLCLNDRLPTFLIFSES